MKEKIIILMGLFFVFASAVSADNFEYNINKTQLPFNIAEPITINCIPNNFPLNVTYGLFLSGPNLINCTDLNSTDFNIDVSVGNETVVGDYSETVEIFNVDYDFSSQITFFISIFDDTIISNETNQTNQTNQTNTTDFVQVDFNEYEYDICDFSLPQNRTKQITVRGKENQTVYTNYDANFFSLSQNIFVIPNTNYSIIDVNIRLNNLSVGTYERYVNFSIVSALNNTYVKFRFIIRDCIAPIPTYDEMIRVCAIQNKTAEDYLLCQRLQRDYENELYEALLEASEKRTINNQTIKYVNQTERVPVLDLNDPEVVKALKDIPLTWKQMQSDAQERDALNRDLQSFKDNYANEVNKLREESSQQIKEGLSSLTEQNIRQGNTIKMYEEKYIKKGTIWTWIILIAVSGGLVYLFILWREDSFY